MSEVDVGVSSALKCRVCSVGLQIEDDDDLDRKICSFCIKQPAGRSLLVREAAQREVARPEAGVHAPREFTPAEKSMIRRLHGLMPARQLLDILNERQMSDRGATVVPHTMARLEAEIGPEKPTQGAGNWAGLRKLLAKASREGLLERISDQVIDDFAVVWSLNSKQVVALKDIVLGAKENQT